MASKAARQEPTLKGYHTGTRVEAEDNIPRGCVLLEKTQGPNGGFLGESMPRIAEIDRIEIQRAARESRKSSGLGSCAEKPREWMQLSFRNIPSCFCAAGGVR